MREDYFSAGDSPLHRCSVSVKLLAALLFIATFAITPRYQSALVYLFISLVLALIARLSFKRLIQRLLLANFFTLFLLITLPLTYGGQLIVLWGMPISKAGLELGLLITLKTNGILLALIALLGTSTVSALGHGLHTLGVSARLTALLLLSYRYVFVIEQEFKRLQRAAKMRGFSATTSRHTYRTYGYLIGMTLVKSWDQSQRTYQAMLLRGYHGQFFFLARQPGNKPFDLLLLISLATASALLTFLGYWW